jgi:hypothetical protein
LPCECAQRIREVYRAQSLGDNEGVFENALRIIELPFDMTSTFVNGLELLFKGLLYFGFATSTPFLKKLSKGIPVAGLIVGGFETFFELRSFKHAWGMLKVLKMPPEDALYQFKMQYCQTSQMVKNITNFVKNAFANCSEEEQQRTIDDYIQQANAARARRLERRIGREAADRFYQAATPTGSELYHQEILTDIHTQVKKQLLLHTLGLLAALASIAGIITMLYGCPFLIPLLLVSISSGLTAVHWLLTEGMLPCRGWKFEVSYLFPECLRRRFFTPTGAVSPYLQGRVRRVRVD